MNKNRTVSQRQKIVDKRLEDTSNRRKKNSTNPSARIRRWCWTLNNYTTEEVTSLTNIESSYTCWGYEIAPTTGTPHLQGYITFKEGKTLSAMKKIPGFERANFQIAGGDDTQCITYCAKELIRDYMLDQPDFYKSGMMFIDGKCNSDLDVNAILKNILNTNIENIITEIESNNTVKYEKYCKDYNLYLKHSFDDELKHILKYFLLFGIPNEETVLAYGRDENREFVWRQNIGTPRGIKLFFEKGKFDPKKRGKRSDIDRAREMILCGDSLLDVACTINNFQAIQYAQKLITLLPPTRNFKSEVYWIWGPSDVGKSWTARNMCDSEYWSSSDDLKWFDGYIGQEYAILNDFRGHTIKWDFFLRLLDEEPLRVPIKGGFTDWRPKVIFITAPISPVTMYNDWCNSHGEDIFQLLRRITEIIYIESRDSIPISTKGRDATYSKI